MLDSINIILSHTSHPGNIGAAARAMKTMGLSKMILVKPKNFPSFEATVRASKADDVLADARVYPTMDEALKEFTVVVGCSARSRHLDVPILTAREMAEKVVSKYSAQKVAIMFGTENAGLTNEELSRCHYQVFIPANPDYSSLNLASAVQLISYEMRVAVLGNSAKDIEREAAPRVTAELMEGFYQHLEQTLIETGYHNPQHPKMLMSRLRRIYNRTTPDHSEMQILRGILSSIQKTIKNQ
ncbi:MAG: tRNA (cytosine(32)/uridine(32)-2'-O)-methyltransferase TrmJ [Gammaproteobacteria bacterium]|nr:MAG: tRNA (cytosine(32)/uridine(32)-2'-O)-methyltransferase TrmJ [Gammaproteobacteria bacterium]